MNFEEKLKDIFNKDEVVVIRVGSRGYQTRILEIGDDYIKIFKNIIVPINRIDVVIDNAPRK